MSKPRYVIVVALDYSQPSELAFEKALQLAADNGEAELHVLNVCTGESAVGEMNGIGASPSSPNDAGLYLENHVARSVTDFQSRTGSNPFKWLVTHVRLADPGRQIAQLAAEVAADLVVIGTHDRHGLPRLILGSVAEAVARLAPCSVLVVRPKMAASEARPNPARTLTARPVRIGPVGRSRCAAA